MTPCLADETIAAWAAGALTDAERERAIEHAASCSLCRTLVGHLVTESSPRDARIGRYEIRGPLGAGGMGVVLRGHDAKLGRDVAIKMMRSTLLDPAHRERMLAEAQAMAKVRHPNVVTVHELGEAGDELYVAMELVEGTMLQRWLATPRPRAQRLALVVDIGRGIAAVHGAGLLHRDIKPDNLIVRDDATAVLVDFGLARPTAKPALGMGSGIAGTPRYLAPEVAAGAPASAASDQYQWWTLVEDALADERAVARLVERGHDPDPTRRFATMRDAVAALEHALRPSRSRWIIAALAAAALASVALVVVVTRDRQPAATACDIRAPKGWSLPRRASIGLAVQRAGLDPRPVLADLDARVAKTIELRERACRAGDAAGRAEWTRRSVCVDETWAKTGVLFANLESADNAVVREAADDLGEVPTLERCARGSLPAVPESLDASTRARYDQLAKEIFAIERDPKLPARERTAKLRGYQTQVEQLGYPPLDARWHWALGRTLVDATDVTGAAAQYDLAARAGLAAGDDNMYVRALMQELALTSLTSSPDHIAQLETQAQAGAQRLASPEIDAELARNRAMLYMDRGDAAKARAFFEEADALYTKLSVAPMMMHVAVLQNLGAVCLEAGDHACAERALDRAVDVSLRRYTADGAPYWETRAARSVLYLGKGDYAKAESEMRAAADGLARTQPTGTQVGRLRSYLCQLLLQRKQFAAARAECAASLASIRAVIGADSPHEIWPLVLSGQVELNVSAYGDALAFLERAAAIAKTGNVRSLEANVAQAYYAIALKAAKRTKEARSLAVKVAPILRAAELAETRKDFVASFPDLTKTASP